MDENGQTRRQELKAFLRARRDAVAPESVGLSRGKRRLAPGLRREEVAAIAGVGLTWYTWLEQGRDINPSPALLRRIAGALALSASDETYLLSLGGHPLAEAPVPAFEPSAALASVMAAYHAPVVVMDALFNVLASNPLADLLYDFDKGLDPFPRNQIWQLFVNPRRQALYPDLEADRRNFVALFRFSSRSKIGTSGYVSLIEALGRTSPEFAAVWNEREIAPAAPRAARLRHPVFGDIAVNALRLPIDADGGAMLVFLGAADEKTSSKFSSLSLSAASQ
jgi:transcriptional regulator with XRE-family HTH domain